jgi:precorrin-2 dehydrogenase/sirohydrochlorin ferrochelatase
MADYGSMRYYPVFLDLQGVSCLVVGGGRVGERKVKTLQACGARLFLISRELTPYLEEEVRQGRLTFLAPDYDERYLKDMFLVIGATDDPVLNRRIGKEAKERGLLCNIADQPADCNFILPSLVVRGDLIIAVSTAGNSPALAKRIRMDLERMYSESYGPYLHLLGELRKEILALHLPQEENQKIFEALVEAPVRTWMEEGDFPAFKRLLDRLLSAHARTLSLGEKFRSFFPDPS